MISYKIGKKQFSKQIISYPCLKWLCLDEKVKALKEKVEYTFAIF